MDNISNHQAECVGPLPGSPGQTLTGLSRIWKKERLGLSMIAGSLVVIAAIIQLIFFFQHNSAEDDMRKNGMNLAKMMAEIPYDEIQPARTDNLFRMIYASQSDSRLAYISLVNIQGESIYEELAPGISLPATTNSYRTPSNLMGEQHLTLTENEQVLEFFSPWLVDSELMGYIRLGYFTSKPTLGVNEISFLTSVALLIFLLTPLFYAFILRELRQLDQNRDESSGINIEQNLSKKSGSVSELMQHYSHYTQNIKNRIVELEDERSSLITSSSIAAYQYNKFAAILHTYPDGVLVLDQSGVITFANNKIATMFATTVKTILDEPVQNWCSESALSNYIANLTSDAYASKTTADFNVGEGENKKVISSSTFPIYGLEQQNETLGSLLLLRDNTQQSIAESYREEFVAHICHELKTPLNTLSLYSEELMNQDDVSEEFRLEAINVIYDETHRMKDLINNLLNISKIETGSMPLNLQRVKLHEFLVDIFDNIAKSAGSSEVKFYIDVPESLVDMALDKTLFRIVISNLMTNAIKYNRPDGEVTLRMEELENSIKISVIDSGIGISDDDKERVFEKYYRSTDDNIRQKSGHGLGLALARDIVQLHNGSISVNSELGVGSEFIVEIYKDADLLLKIG